MASNVLSATGTAGSTSRRFAVPRRVVRWCILLGLAAILIVAALVRPLDHDEGQYVASAVLAHSGLPYRDFDYLQTPLQPLLFAPLTLVWPGHILLVLRLTSAALGYAAVLLLTAALRKSGLAERRAWMFGLMLAVSEPFLFGAGTVRNDILPCALECAALSIAVGDGVGARRRSALFGMCLALACAAKISYAFLLAAVLPAELSARRHGDGRLSLPAFLYGAALPLALVAALALAAPHAFWFDVIRFPAEEPREWYGAGPDRDKLTTLGRTLDYLKFAMLGPARRCWPSSSSAIDAGRATGARAAGRPVSSMPC